MKRYVNIPHGLKDEHGAYIALPKKESAPPLADLIPEPGSIDEIGDVILVALARAVKKIATKITHDDVSREVIGALKDCESMHRELLKREEEFLKSLTKEELEQLANAALKIPTAIHE